MVNPALELGTIESNFGTYVNAYIAFKYYQLLSSISLIRFRLVPMHLPQQTLPDATLLPLRWWCAVDSSYVSLLTISWLRSASAATLSTSPVGTIIWLRYWCSATASSTRSSTPPSTVSFSRASDVCCQKWIWINSSLEFQQLPEAQIENPKFCVFKIYSSF